MKDETIKLLEELFAAAPNLVGGPVGRAAIDAAERRIEMKFDADYRDFLGRYGGAMIGSLPIIGLRAAEVMGDESVVDVTIRFRRDASTATHEWVVISVDGRGNPIGMNAKGEVWLSDHDVGDTIMVAPSFEAFIWKLATE